jgi:hypothetical protein
MKGLTKKITGVAQFAASLMMPLWLASAQPRYNYDDTVNPQEQTRQLEDLMTSEECIKKYGTATYFPLHYDQLTKKPKTFWLNINDVYKVKIEKRDSVSRWVEKEEWPEEIQSDSLIGVIYTALNGKSADINNLPENKYMLFLSIDGDENVMGRKGESVPIEETLKIVNKNVYGNGQNKK